MGYSADVISSHFHSFSTALPGVRDFIRAIMEAIRGSRWRLCESFTALTFGAPEMGCRRRARLERRHPCLQRRRSSAASTRYYPRLQAHGHVEATLMQAHHPGVARPRPPLRTPAGCCARSSRALCRKGVSRPVEYCADVHPEYRELFEQIGRGFETHSLRNGLKCVHITKRKSRGSADGQA